MPKPHVVFRLPYAAALLAVLAATLPLTAAAVRVPPAAAPAPAAEKVAPAGRLVADGAPRTYIGLPAPSAAERTVLKSANAATRIAATAATAGTGKDRPLTIGYGRAVPPAQREWRGTDLAWQPLAAGGWAARIDVESPEAAALRIGIKVAAAGPEFTLRFVGSAPGAAMSGTESSTALAAVAARDGVAWSPVLEGSTATIEVYAATSAARGAVALSIASVSHLALAGADLKAGSAKRAGEIGTAGTCEIDVACVTSPSQAYKNAAAAAMQVVFTAADGRTGLCTGTLLNDSVSDFQPYVYMASHCIDTAAVATTINTYWFFDAVTCGALDVPPYVLLSGGAKLLARSQDADWVLLRLNQPPPIGAYYAGWTSDPLPVSVPPVIASTFHHPQGDLKKFSQGTYQGLIQNVDTGVNGFFLKMIWNQGSTEPGSSGAGLFTYYALGGYYELRGGLSAGNASCNLPSGYDMFTRMEVAFPLVRSYLLPTAPNPTGLVAAVEYYAKSLDHYFMTANPVEIAALDSAAVPGWVRTGLRFLAYADPALAPAGASPVCRFYLKPAYGDSHFFSADPAECAQTAQRFGFAWVYESPNVFYIGLPDPVTGACATGTHPLWRFFNAATINHRYTAEKTIRDGLRADPDWVPEGYGPDAVIMCSPDG